MTQPKIGTGFKMRLEFVLEQVFEGLSFGGDHQTRAAVARRLLNAAQSGILKLDDLTCIAKEALVESLQAPNTPQMRTQRLEQRSPGSHPIPYE